MQVCSTHLYHAVSLIRGLLGVGFAPAVVHAREFTAPLVDPLTPDGWTDDADAAAARRRRSPRSTSAGAWALYDFTDNQWWNPLRGRRIVMRGTHRRDRRRPGRPPGRSARPRSTSPLVHRRTGVDLNLEGNDLDHISFDGRVVYRNPFPGARFSEDDIARRAAARAHRRVGARRGSGAVSAGRGPAGSPLSVAIEESAASGREVRVGGEPWTGVH